MRELVGPFDPEIFFQGSASLSQLESTLSLLTQLMATPHPPMPLKGVVQNYTWGKRGSESAVAKLAGSYEEVDESRTYAGTSQCSMPSTLLPARFALFRLLLLFLCCLLTIVML